MANNLIIPFATGNGAAVPTDAAWATAPVIAQGFQIGVADPTYVNKALRQSTAAASGFGQFVADWSARDFTDSLTSTAMRDNFRIGLAAALASAYFAPDTSGTPNTIALSLTPQPVVINGFYAIEFKAANTSTGAATVALNGFSNASLVRRDGSALQSGDIVANRYYRMIYDAATSRYVMATPVPSESAGTGNAVPIVQAAKSPFNLKQIQSTLRTSASAASAGTLVTVFSGTNYTKQSATSTIIAWATFQTYTTTQNGAVTMRLSFGSGFADAGTTNGYTPSGAFPMSQLLPLIQPPLILPVRLSERGRRLSY